MFTFFRNCLLTSNSYKRLKKSGNLTEIHGQRDQLRFTISIEIATDKKKKQYYLLPRIFSFI